MESPPRERLPAPSSSRWRENSSTAPRARSRKPASSSGFRPSRRSRSAPAGAPRRPGRRVTEAACGGPDRRTRQRQSASGAGRGECHCVTWSRRSRLPGGADNAPAPRRCGVLVAEVGEDQLELEVQVAAAVAIDDVATGAADERRHVARPLHRPRMKDQLVEIHGVLRQGRRPPGLDDRERGAPSARLGQLALGLPA